MSKIKFKIGTIEDIDMLSHLSGATFTESFGADNTEQNMTSYINEYFNPLVLKHELEDTNNLYCIVYFEDKPAGYFKLRFNAYFEELEDYLPIEIVRLYFLKEYHRLGLGKRSIEYIINLSKKNQYNLLWLAVWEHNFNAITFYEKMRFIKFSSKPFILGNDKQTDICYKLMLN